MVITRVGRKRERERERGRERDRNRGYRTRLESKT
jgi:hypothetical protein